MEAPDIEGAPDIEAPDMEAPDMEGASNPGMPVDMEGAAVGASKPGIPGDALKLLGAESPRPESIRSEGASVPILSAFIFCEL